MILYIHVIPNAKHNEIIDDAIDLFNNRTIKIKVSAVPENGKANTKLIEVLSDYLNIPKNKIIIKKGTISRKKIIEIKNN